MRRLSVLFFSLSSCVFGVCTPPPGWSGCVVLTQAHIQNGSSNSSNFPVGLIGTCNGSSGTGFCSGSNLDLRTVANGGKIQNTIPIGGIKTATYTSGGSFSGTGTCTLTSFSNATGATANIAVVSGTPGTITMTAPGSGATAGAWGATLGSGTATCSGTATGSSHVNLTANVLPADLLITSDSLGSTPLPYETASYNPSTGDIQLFHNESISNTADTLSYAFFGNSSVTTYQGNDVTAWNTGFIAVFHFELNTLVSSAIQDTYDSTGSGLIQVSVGGNIATTTGIAAGLAASFSGSNHTSQTAHPATNLFPNGSGTRTLEVWWKHSASFTGLESAVSWGQSSTAAMWAVSGCDSGACGTGGNTFLNIHYLNASCFTEPFTNDSNPHYSALTYPTGQTREDQASKYLDGSSTSCTFSSPATTVNTTDPGNASGGFDIGNLTGSSNPWHGQVDEIRISNVARSADWILATYNNFHTPGSFISAGNIISGASRVVHRVIFSQ